MPWEHYVQNLYRSEELGFSLDLSRMHLPPGFFDAMAAPVEAAFRQMEVLEAGGIVNVDERRQVGHYWLRDPDRAPAPELARDIRETGEAVHEFARAVHAGVVTPPTGERFRNLLLIGIGGSALGPQLLADALAFPGQPLRPYFLDNTDPEGIARVLGEIGEGRAETLTLVVSKSGKTKETRNGMCEAQAWYAAGGLEFHRHAVAVTELSDRSDLYREARSEDALWLGTFPMWDWVGGRTSVFSAVGLLPAALLDFDTEGLLRGAREMDGVTRPGAEGSIQDRLRANPAALLALAWHHARTAETGEKDMVVLPYRDRLLLFPRYLQQLIMESLGKEYDLAGRRVNEGIVVYGNKGSTDQHAYVQQLREGADNCFVTFIRVLTDDGTGLEVEPGVTSGDYLHGFLLGTREALAENGRESLTLTLDRFDAAALGRLIALFDRAVGYYASLVGINAYHQPGVEAGKKAAERVIALQSRVLSALRETDGPLTAREAAAAAGVPGEVEAVYHILMHLAFNPGRGVAREAGSVPGRDRFRAA